MGRTPAGGPWPALALALTAAALAACSLPRGAAMQGEITAEATQAGAARTIQVVPVTRETLPMLARWPVPPAAGSARPWPGDGGGRGISAPVIRPGDVLTVQVWESDENSLLTAPAQKAVAIEGLAVSPRGTVFLPYVGEVEVAGRTPDEARAHIQTQVDAVLTSPQVVLGVTPGRQNTVDLVGGVARPGAYPLPDRSTTVLSLIAQGGGIAPGLANPQLRLVRGGAVYGISAARLFAEPARDIVLRGGDKVIVEADPASFLALGATGSQTVVAFPKDEVSALDALALIGGLEAGRANAQGLLILREYPARAVRPEGSTEGPDRGRVVFTLDLTTADGLFSARSFRIRPGDLVLATESPVTSVRTVFGLLGQVLGLTNRLDG
jgi:polysaccharide export outer membrane protein